MYLNFKEYKLAIPNNCESNYIDIYGDKLNDIGRKQRFCGTQAEPVRSDGNHMNIRFFAKSDALNNVLFEITFTAFRELPNKGNVILFTSVCWLIFFLVLEHCREDEFDCEDSTCIDISLKCNGIDNCKYRYDEDKQTTCAVGECWDSLSDRVQWTILRTSWLMICFLNHRQQRNVEFEFSTHGGHSDSVLCTSVRHVCIYHHILLEQN